MAGPKERQTDPKWNLSGRSRLHGACRPAPDQQFRRLHREENLNLEATEKRGGKRELAGGGNGEHSDRPEVESARVQMSVPTMGTRTHLSIRMCVGETPVPPGGLVWPGSSQRGGNSAWSASLAQTLSSGTFS